MNKYQNSVDFVVFRKFYSDFDYCWHFILTYVGWDKIIKKSEYKLMKELLTCSKSEITLQAMKEIQDLVLVIDEYCKVNSLYDLTLCKFNKDS